MSTYVWQVTLLLSVRVSAPTRGASEQKLQEVMPELAFKAGAGDGEAMVVGMEVEGEVDLVDVIDDGVSCNT